MRLDKKIDQYSDELYTDLGLMDWPEEQKAEIYARIEDHLHKVILETLGKVLKAKETRAIRSVLEQEDYARLAGILKHYPQHAAALEQKVQEEFDRLKITITEEQKHANKA